jgi:F-type H+-transporting ATPase subunit gamma
MTALRDLKKRLESVRTTGKLAGAMKTVATAKFGRISNAAERFGPYAEAEREIARLAREAYYAENRDETSGDEAPFGEINEAPPLYVLIASNRGLCGGYNHDLFTFFSENVLKRGGDKLIVPCGRMAMEYCREKGLPVLREFAVSDAPKYEEARELSEYLYSVFDEGRASEVSFVCQEYHNMMRQTPAVIRFLPIGESGEEGAKNAPPVLFVPDAETVLKELIPVSLAAAAYSRLNYSALGASASMLLAMRAAYDNSNEQAAALETAINRRRQAEITQSVIETAAERRD